jgi:hypothetical protein
MSARTAKDVIADWLCDRSDRAYSEAEGGANSILSALRSAGFAVVPVEPTREMLNAAIDTDRYKLGDISPLGFRCSPQQMFNKAYEAMLKAAQEDSRE